jgi:hypothetical protein
MPQKHDNYTRKVFDGIGHGGGWGGVGGGKSDYKDCFRSQKLMFSKCDTKTVQD